MKACPSYPKLFQTRALSGGGQKKIKKSHQNMYLVWIVLLAEKKSACAKYNNSLSQDQRPHRLTDNSNSCQKFSQNGACWKLNTCHT